VSAERNAAVSLGLNRPVVLSTLARALVVSLLVAVQWLSPFLAPFLAPFPASAQLRPATIDAAPEGTAAPEEARPIEGPPDVSLERDLTIPPLPPDFVRRTAGTLTFEMPAAAESTMRDVIDSAATEWVRITGELGADPVAPLLIRVGRNPEEMARLAPLEAPPPEYAVGVAYPALDLVLLTLTAPETWERPDVPHVFSHELAHVALHRAVRGVDGERTFERTVPRWFDEGIAIHLAGERSIERVETLWQGTISGQLIPLDRLDRGFPSRPHAVSLAYAESADFVAFILRRGDDGPAKLRQLLERIRGGDSFEGAVSLTFTSTLGQLEDEWRTALGERYGAAPLLLGSGLAWVVVGFLIVLAFRKRRVNNKKVLLRWSEEEKIEEEREALRARARQILLARRAMEEQAREQRAKEALAGSGGEAARGDPVSDPDADADPDVLEAHSEAEGDPAPPPPKPEVPSILFEGDRHTLH
jgi:hypothetical protein